MLPIESREVILLREHEELYYREIASVLDCPSRTAMSRLQERVQSFVPCFLRRCMTWKQIKAEALRIVDEVAQRKADLELTEYQNKVRYRSDHPAGMTMRDHNAIVREAMREAVRRGIYCVRSVVR